MSCEEQTSLKNGKLVLVWIKDSAHVYVSTSCLYVDEQQQQNY